MNTDKGILIDAQADARATSLFSALYSTKIYRTYIFEEKAK